MIKVLLLNLELDLLQWTFFTLEEMRTICR